MYKPHLLESLVPAQTDDNVWETTVGGILREVASQHPSALALVEVDMEGQTGRSWTYGERLSDSEKLALALSTRFRPGERIVVWAPNIPEWLLPALFWRKHALEGDVGTVRAPGNRRHCRRSAIGF